MHISGRSRSDPVGNQSLGLFSVVFRLFVLCSAFVDAETYVFTIRHASLADIPIAQPSFVLARFTLIAVRLCLGQPIRNARVELD